MTLGIITQLLPARRLGFVRPAVGGIPLLCNASAVEEVSFDDLREGQAVTYSLERDRLWRRLVALVELHYHEQSGQPGPSCVVNTDEIETIMDVDGHASIKLRGKKPNIYTHEAYEQVLKLIHSG